MRFSSILRRLFKNQTILDQTRKEKKRKKKRNWKGGGTFLRSASVGPDFSENIFSVEFPYALQTDTVNSL